MLHVDDAKTMIEISDEVKMDHLENLHRNYQTPYNPKIVIIMHALDSVKSLLKEYVADESDTF